MTRTAGPPRLLTIPISHYCEKARWALERGGIPYREEAHLQMVHRFVAVRHGGGRKVPVLITADGALNESARIIRWVDDRLPEERRLVPIEQFAEVGELERHLDEELGVQGRRWMYSVVMDTDVPSRYGTGPMPAWERRAMPLVLPVLKLYLGRFMEVGPEQAQAAMVGVERTFDEVEAMISDGRRYLLGDRFTAADLAFAALSAAVLMPDRYGVPLPGPDAFPAEVGAQVRALRKRPAGRFAARLVAEERPWPPASVSSDAFAGVV